MLEHVVPVRKRIIQGVGQHDMVNYRAITVRSQAALNPEDRPESFSRDGAPDVHGGATAVNVWSVGQFSGNGCDLAENKT